MRSGHGKRSSTQATSCVATGRLLERLETLSVDAVRAAVEDHLRRVELEALVARRDLIVGYFRKLVAEEGEAAVLY